MLIKLAIASHRRWEEDLCRIIPHVPLMIHLVMGLNYHQDLVREEALVNLTLSGLQPDFSGYAERHYMTSTRILQLC